MSLLAPWRSLSLAAQFAIAGGAVLVIANLLTGVWVANRIEQGVVRNTAHATALYMESFIAPVAQELTEHDELPEHAQENIRASFEDTPLGERVVSYKIWKKGGLVAHASDPDLIGKTFEPTDNLRAAWKGEVRADFDELGDPEDVAEGALGLPLLEIYSPIRETGSGQIIAIAEFYERAEKLSEDLTAARRNSWLAVTGLMGAIGLLLFAIVLGGSRTIERQQRQLTTHLEELQELSQHNAALRFRVQNAAERASAMNDRTMRTVGADLHDGPAQLLALAALKLDDLRAEECPDTRAGQIDRIESVVREAIDDIRHIARGLSLPDIAHRSPAEIVTGVAEAHSARTSTEVALKLDEGGDCLNHAGKICIYRFTQEGLRNAFVHGGGLGQEVKLEIGPDRVRLVVSDRGPGFASERREGGLGLSGLRDRVESIGGTFRARNREGGGSEICMALDIGRQGT